MDKIVEICTHFPINVFVKSNSVQNLKEIRPIKSLERWETLDQLMN